MKVTFPYRCAVLLLLTSMTPVVWAQDSSSAAAAQSSSSSVQDQMSELARELRAIREENQELKGRLAKLEQTQPPAPAPPPPPPPAPKAAESGPPPWEGLLKNFTPFGEVGIRYQGLFNHGGLPDHAGDNFYNRAEGLMRLGLRGQVAPRLSYVLRLSTGVSTEGGDPWIAFADPGDRRFIGLDEYYLVWTAYKGEKTTSLMFGGKLANVPAALGNTELIVDKDFGLHLFANLSIFQVAPKTSLSFLSSVGFVTNGGAINIARSLQPPVNGFGGAINDINQYGAPRAQAYVGQLRGDHEISPSTKIHGSFGFVNVSHPTDVPVFLGATGLFTAFGTGLDGLRVPNMPQGTSTNLPRKPTFDANNYAIDFTQNFNADLSRNNPLALSLFSSGGASAFHILDTFGSVTLHADKKYPIRLLTEWSDNLGAGAFIFGPASGSDITTDAGLKKKAQQQRMGLITGFDIGNEAAVHQHYFSYKFVLIGSEATLTYVNNDQWHTNIRGHDFTYQYRLTPNVVPFFTLVAAQNYDARLVGFSSLARFPSQNLTLGMDPWMFRPRFGVLVSF